MRVLTSKTGLMHRLGKAPLWLVLALLLVVSPFWPGASAQKIHIVSLATEPDPENSEAPARQADAIPADAPTHEPSVYEPSVYEPSIVVLWNEVMLAAVRNGPPRPTVTARNLFLVHQAMYDAWSLYDARALPSVLSANLRRPQEEQTPANKAEAVANAAYHMLQAVYPDYGAQTGAYDRLIRALGYKPVSQPDGSPAGIGLLAARGILLDRANDGSNAINNFADTTSEIYPALYSPLNSGDPTAPNGLYGPSFDANHWEPIWVATGAVKNELGIPVLDPTNPASYRPQSFLTPHWGAVRPFALTHGAQFRPPAPPKMGSDALYVDALGRVMTNDAAYHMQADEILHISANLTDEQKVIAEYWADGPRSETPPGHWNALAHGISARDRHTVDDDVKLYFALNGALFDASIAAWDAKRAYDCVRPISAIRYKYRGQMVQAWAGPNQGTQWIKGETWLPYQDLTFVTPPFAEFVSGHSTFSAAAATVLTQFTGSSRFYDGKTILYNEDFNRDGVPDLLGQHVVKAGGNMFENSPASVVVLQWETFQEAADEAGISRRYGGIHFQDGDLRGREMGRNIGVLAFDMAQRYWTGEGAR